MTRDPLAEFWADTSIEDAEHEDDCPHACDHCRPEFWHGCVLVQGHSGYHSCAVSR